MPPRGSKPTGPSAQYVRLLKGEISAKTYVKGVQKRVSAERRTAPAPSPRRA